jgi:hypothetical protein
MGVYLGRGICLEVSLVLMVARRDSVANTKRASGCNVLDSEFLLRAKRGFMNTAQVSATQGRA